jgi:hypothetical protein
MGTHAEKVARGYPGWFLQGDVILIAVLAFGLHLWIAVPLQAATA